jgi:hypothetical protein
MQVFNEEVFDSLVGCDDYAAHLMNVICWISLVLNCILGGIFVLACFVGCGVMCSEFK